MARHAVMGWASVGLVLAAVFAAGGEVIPVPAGRGLLEAVLSRSLPRGTVLALEAGEHVVVNTLAMNNSHRCVRACAWWRSGGGASCVGCGGGGAWRWQWCWRL
jgi:hypothetical protein